MNGRFQSFEQQARKRLMVLNAKSERVNVKPGKYVSCFKGKRPGTICNTHQQTMAGLF
jgi:hypothetical protein